MEWAGLKPRVTSSVFNDRMTTQGGLALKKASFCFSTHPQLNPMINLEPYSKINHLVYWLIIKTEEFYYYSGSTSQAQ